MKTHLQTTFQPQYSPAYLANGLVGLRVNAIPLPRGAALVNGFVGVSPEKSTEEYAEAPYPVGLDLAIDGVRLSQNPYLAEFQRQEYDFSCGELRSEFLFRARGKTATVHVLTFCSRTMPAVTLQEVTVEVDQPCMLVLQAQVDPRGLSGKAAYQSRPNKHQDGVLQWESAGGLSTLGVAYRTDYLGENLKQQRRNDYGHEADLQLTEYQIDAVPGKPYVLRQACAMVPSLMHGEPHWQAARLVGYASWYGFDKLRAANRDAWAELWKARPLLSGAGERWQDITDAAFFYLHSSVHAATPCGIAPFGLSQRCEYSGHMFWDTDTFMFPPLLLSAPDAAQAVMDYRSRQALMARFNARLQGWRGLQFPWQTGVGGFEVTPYYAGACGGISEQHINLDVAFAMAQYAHATGDDLFLRQQAWPVLQGVAEWIESRVTRTERGCELLHITGIDESRDNVHNNAETNGLAVVVLREAVAMARRLGLTPPPAWERIAANMYMPVHADGYLLKHDDYEYTGGLCIPETMMLYFPFGYQHSPAVDKATADFYLANAHTYFGWPMMAGALTVWAARAGKEEMALTALEQAIASRVWDPYMMFSEFGRKVNAEIWNIQPDILPMLFLTCTGELLSALYYGFTGLQLDAGDPAGWARYPVALPEGWEAIEVERVWVRGEPARLIARRGEERVYIG